MRASSSRQKIAGCISTGKHTWHHTVKELERTRTIPVLTQWVYSRTHYEVIGVQTFRHADAAPVATRRQTRLGRKKSGRAVTYLEQQWLPLKTLHWGNGGMQMKWSVFKWVTQRLLCYWWSGNVSYTLLRSKHVFLSFLVQPLST